MPTAEDNGSSNLCDDHETTSQVFLQSIKNEKEGKSSFPSTKISKGLDKAGMLETDTSCCKILSGIAGKYIRY